MKVFETVKRGCERVETAGLKLGIRLEGWGARRAKRGLSTVETIALTVVVVGAVVFLAGTLNEKMNNVLGRAFDKIASNLGI